MVGWVAPVSAADSVAAAHAVAAIVAFAAGASVQSVASSHRSHFVSLAADAPAPVAVGASAVPGPVSAEAFAAVADISGPSLHSLYLAQQGVPWAEGH